MCDGRRHRQVVAVVARWYLPVVLVLAMVVGVSWPAPGAFLARTPTESVAIVALFFLAGLELHLENVRALVSLWPASLFGVVSILLITPLIALLVRFLPVNEFVGLGITSFAVAPTTVSSGVVLVAQGHGNVTLGLLLTVATNLLCVVTIPFLLPWILASQARAQKVTANLEPIPVLIQLLYLVLLPLVVGQVVLRAIAVVRRQVSSSVNSLFQLSGYEILWAALAVIAMHAVFLAFHAVVASATRMPRDIARAIVIMCSQKTLTVSFAILATVPSRDAGIAAIPIVLGHLSQILADAFLVAHWETRDAKEERKLDNHGERSPEGVPLESSDTI
ncbi:unnamed protein product (mitochondrion) [Plasmodiophora brassicae]|uniref:Bile acid:sodium symporter n=1 Tax=Plasmodiophora brassicae TaxID=37360 RepID=A0A3P3YC07_PLABS|nr:unnamed protein product [Plasmodiophora brassicae]